MVTEFNLKLDDLLLEELNCTHLFESEQLDYIGSRVVEGYQQDESSRAEWLERNREWMKLAMQMVESKSFPFQGASNVKYPLLTIAATQFSARTYPVLVDAPNLVRTRIIGYDHDGTKDEIADRIGKHMSYQLLEQMDEWEEDMDRMSHILPIIGCAFKKTYYSPLLQRNVSEMILPRDLSVNYWAKNLETASRKTHKLEMSRNDIFERATYGIFADVDLKGDAVPTNDRATLDQVQGTSPPVTDEDTPRSVLEQHCFWDFDGDGYKEPYIITVDEDTRKVLRIVPRFDEDSLKYTEDGTLYCIVPTEYFTKFPFIPSPDGGFYDVGFGSLLGPMNETINTLINQLVDAGTLNNLQGGFISRGVRIRKGEQSFLPGEWKTVDASGDDLRKGIVPLPAKEPSMVLFNLLGMMIEAGERLASTKDIMVGESPGQNQPATTSMAVLEQGLKVFSAIVKRLYRALKKEYEKLFVLNSKYLSEEEYFTILDVDAETVARIGKSDYDTTSFDVVPNADPRMVSEQQRHQKIGMLLELMPLGLNVEEVKKRALQAQNQHNIEALLEPNPPPPPDPQIMLKIEELKLKAITEQEKNAVEKLKVQNLGVAQETQAILNLAKAQSEQTNQRLAEVSQRLEAIRVVIEDRAQQTKAQEPTSGID